MAVLSEKQEKPPGKTGNEGIDGIIKEDKLGFDVIYVQAKRWQTVRLYEFVLLQNKRWGFIHIVSLP